MLCAQVYSNGRQRLDDLCALPYSAWAHPAVGDDVSDCMAGSAQQRELKGVHELEVRLLVPGSWGGGGPLSCRNGG